MSSHILGLGTAAPRFSISPDDAAEIAVTLCPGTEEERQLLHTFYRQAGIRQRGSVVLQASANESQPRQDFFLAQGKGPTTGERMEVYERSATELATAAAHRALADGGLKAAEITHLVTVSCTGFSAPGFDVGLFERLQLSAHTSRTHLGFMGCHGALNGLRVADAFAASQPKAAVLVCAAELCTLHHLYSHRRDHVIANALFGDGAAAAICGGKAFEHRAAAKLVQSGSTIVPNTLDLMAWQIRDHGFEMTLSPAVPQVIEQQLQPWLSAWLHDCGHTVKTIGSWAIHPGGPRILSACARALDLPDDILETSQEVLANHGNMSSPTILFILQELRRSGLPFPWVALAFGPGLTIEAALCDAAD